jgi:hypothetical protein
MALSSDEFNAHFPTEVTEDIVRFADSLFPGYIFTERKGRRQLAHCTHCKHEWMTNGLRHGEDSACPTCGMACTVKASGRSRKWLVDEAYFVWYDKSLTDPGAVVARGIHAVRDYHGAYKGVQTGFMDCAMYLFMRQRGGCEHYNRYCYYSMNSTYHDNYHFYAGDYYKCATVYSLWSKKNIRVSYSRPSLAAAVQGTPFEPSGWEQYDYEDMVRFMAAAARYPCIEYLTKLGFKALVEGKISGGTTYGAVNWNGRTAASVLRLPQQDINDLRRNGIKPSFGLLCVLQASRKDGSNFSALEASELSTSHFQYYLKEIIEHREYGSLRKIAGYLKKQASRDQYRRDVSSQWSDWRDYIKDAKQLKYDLTDETVLWPRDLHQAHQNTISQIKAKKDELLAEQVKKRAAKLASYRFETDMFLIRPARDTTELINEGKALHHCVGNYAPSYASGHTAILFVRRAVDPDTPFVTVEVRGGMIMQTRGKNNCAPDEDVKAFLEAFKAEKLDKKSKRREKIA